MGILLNSDYSEFLSLGMILVLLSAKVQESEVRRLYKEQTKLQV